MQDTSYGSPLFSRACQIVAAYGEIADREPRAVRAVWLRVRAGSPRLMLYRLRLPSVRVRLSPSSPGRMIAQHFAIRERGHWKFRRAQGVLTLPAEFSLYMRGRHRQAVRTNVRHARDAGFTVEFRRTEDWAPGTGDFRAAHITPGPVEEWVVLDREGAVVASSILSVDEEVALLHGLVSSSSYARWLLHTAIVERLCGRCKVLLTNSPDAYLVGVGNQHFQRLLGYEIMRLRLRRSSRSLPSRSKDVEGPVAGAGIGRPPAPEPS
ncbi:MAG: hypothetical protein ACTHN3_11355 [Solirubrobacterales bacterium]